MSTPKEGSRDTGQGIIVCLTPDVCKTPVGSSLPPVPYSITAKQGDDANTVSTVRMTKQRAHNMASLVTKCTGDQPGTGTGVKSGTVGSVCHPKTHSSSVNIEGKPAIRHTDEWYMNNKNTVGKLTYVVSSETFNPTPAIALAQDPQLEAPEEMSPTMEAILRGMERAREDDESDWVQYAQQSNAQTMTDALPDRTYVPNSAPNTTVTGPAGAPANDNTRPTNRLQTPAVMQGRPSLEEMLRSRGIGVSRTQVGGLAGALITGAELAQGPGIARVLRSDQSTLANDYGIVLDMDNPIHYAILDEYRLNRGPSFMSRYYRGMSEAEAVPIVRERLRELEAMETAAAAGADSPDDASETESEVTAANVRVVAVGNGGGGGGDPCDFHEHSGRDCPDDYPSHHIIQDMFFRVGPRSSLERPAGAPTIGEGMSICLETDAHDRLHRAVEGRLREMGQTANLFDLADISADALKDELNSGGIDCDAEIDELLQEFKDSLGENGNELLGRSSNRPGPAANNALRESWGLPPRAGPQ